MKYTRKQILKTIDDIEGGFCTDEGTFRAIAVACMRECLKNRQEPFEKGDILYLGPNQFNGDWGIFLKYADEDANACIVLTTITRHGYISAAYWEMNEVEKIGHIDISCIESVLQTGGQG